jgi:hypothetical protein
VPIISRWQEGRVDRTGEHFELRYESIVNFESDWSDWIPVARVGPPKARIVNVQFLVDSDDLKNAAAISGVTKEIQFYLIDKREPNPWRYAQYHCGTSSNIYSRIHWGYFEAGDRDQIQGKAEMKSTADKRPELPRKLSVNGTKMLWVPERKAATTPKRSAAGVTPDQTPD